MVDLRTETRTNNSKPVNPRDAIRESRQRRLQLISAGKVATVKVYAADDMMREVLRHPSGKIRFRDALDQPVEWPNDSFTARRIADGSVRTDGPGTSGYSEPDESLNPREQAAARKPKAKPEPSNHESSRQLLPEPQSQPQSELQPELQPDAQPQPAA